MAVNAELTSLGVTGIYDGQPVRALEDIIFGIHDNEGGVVLKHFKGIISIATTSVRSSGQVLAGDTVWKQFVGGVGSVDGTVVLGLFSDEMKKELFGYEEVDGFLAAGKNSIANKISISFTEILFDGTRKTTGLPNVTLTEPTQNARADQSNATDISGETYESTIKGTEDSKGFSIYTKTNIEKAQLPAFIKLVHGLPAGE